MSSNCGVYCIRCKVNNKAYIGSSVDINRRWIEHKSRLKAGNHVNKKLQEDYNKYGADSFLCSILINCKPQYLLKYESMYVLLFDTMHINKGYNITLPYNTQLYNTEYKPLYKASVQYKVQCIETGEIFSSKRDICNNGKDYKNLIEHLQGKRQSYKGYHWKYVY